MVSTEKHEKILSIPKICIDPVCKISRNISNNILYNKTCYVLHINDILNTQCFNSEEAQIQAMLTVINRVIRKNIHHRNLQITPKDQS